jgi:hypothetical protein
MISFKGFGQKGISIMSKSSHFLEYIKLHLISLKQDLDNLHSTEDSYHFVLGNIAATEHLLSVATDIMNSSNERYNNE